MALAPLLTALLHTAQLPEPRATRRAVALGLVAGGLYFAGTVYWTSDVMAVFGGLPYLVAAPVAGLLVAYLALYPALFAAAFVRLARAFGPRALALAPAVWVTSELARGTLFTGFPWVLLGYSQATVLPFMQIASVTGIYGVSALVAAVSAAMVYGLEPRPHRVAVAVGLVLLVGGVAWWGQRRMASDALTSSGVPLTVGVVQGDVEQLQKWDPDYRDAILGRHLELTRAAAARGARLIVWPESSTPFLFEEDAAGADAVRRTVQQSGAALLLGSDQVQRSSPVRYFNAAFLLDPTGKVAGVYRKVQLVPWGEYVPMKHLLYFVGPLVESVSDFSAGDGVTLLPLAQGPITTTICYEAVFPALAREGVRQGSRLLTTITNDAWYGRSSAPYQHFEQATIRAIEEGRYLVRAANTGISAIVDPYGRTLQRSELFEPQVLVGEVRLIAELTTYAKIGDAFAEGCALATMAALVSAVVAKRRVRA